MSTMQPSPLHDDLPVAIGNLSMPRKAETCRDWDVLLESTRKLFPGDLRVTSEFDPEYPEREFTILHVSAHGEINSIVDREAQWIAMLNQLAPGVTGIRLSIDPRL
jgi:hypothetical protein